MIVSTAGNVQAVLGALLLHHFRRQEKAARANVQTLQRDWPAVTVMKPLHGNEPLLRDALETLFLQDYPNFQIVFGFHDATDDARSIVEALTSAYPNVPVTTVIDDREHGPNRKISNLLNMYAQVQHDMIVISDSDIHYDPAYLKHIVTTLDIPDTELATTLYAGRPAHNTLVQQMGACQINHNFLPGVLMSRRLGREDCLGATMALRRKTLETIGGLEALVDHVADDAELGRLICKHGFHIGIAHTLTYTTVGERCFRELFLHELRWGRTVKSVEPIGYGLSAIQLPLFWSTMAVVFQPKAYVTWGVLLISWISRALSSRIIDRATGVPLPVIMPILALRDCLSASVMLGSAYGSRVAWRGRTVHIARRQPTRSKRASDTSRHT